MVRCGTILRRISICLSMCLFASVTLAQAYGSDFERKLDSLVNLSNTLPDGKERLNALDYVCMSHNNVDSVEKYARMELELSKKLADYDMVTSAYLTLGWCYYYRYNYNEANKYYFQALHISDSCGTKRNIAQCYHTIANTMAMMKKFIESDEYDRKALKLFYELNDSVNISSIYRSSGQTCSDFCLYETAKEHLTNALEIDKKLGNKYNIANDYLNLGYVDRDQYKDSESDSLLTSAKNLILEAYNLFKSAKSEIDVMMTCQDLMEVYLDYAKANTGDFRKQLVDSSKMFYSEGLELATKNDFIGDYHYFSITEAQYAIEDKNYRQAYKLLKDIETQLAVSDSTPEFFIDELYEVFVEYYKATRNYKKAYEYRCKSDIIKKNSFNREYALKSASSDVQEEINEVRRKQELTEAKNEILRKEQIRRHDIISITSSVLLVFLTITIIVSYKIMKNKHRLGRILEARNNKIEMHRDQLAIIYDDIQASIFYAKNIQNSMVPNEELMQSIWGDHLIIWRPLNLISGDFYWTTRMGSSKIITAVDCTGHGVPGAFMSVLGMSTLSDIVSSKAARNGELSASDILNQMREKVIYSLRQTEQDSMTLDGMDMGLCIVDEETMKLQYAGAFRPLVIIRDDSEKIYKADKMPVSFLSENQKSFTNHTIDIQDGDTLYMFSDGIPDQFGYNENGDEIKFTTKKLISILVEINRKTFAEQKSILLDKIEKWGTHKGKKKCIQTDDELLIGVRITKNATCEQAQHIN